MLLALILSQAMVDPDILSSPAVTRPWRSTYAFFEAFPVSGAGTTTACSTTAPTGARGESLSFSRASSATCTRTATGGLATTGIGDADLSVLSTNVARVEYSSDGILGLLVEATRTNLLFQFIAIDTAVTWTDVGTPTLTTGQTSPFAGALATGAVQIEDDDGAAFEGRAQSVAVTAASAYFMHCYVKAGTRAEARISIDGTTQDITGLSATTWSIVEKADASASGANIPVQVLVGDAVGDTGTVIWGGCQVELGAYRSSIVPTTTIAVARAADDANFAGLTAFASAPLSQAATVEFSGTRAAGTYATAIATYNSGSLYALLGVNPTGAGWEEFTDGSGAHRSGTATLTTGQRLYGYTTGVGASTLRGGVNGSYGAADTTGAVITFTNIRVGAWASAGSLPLNGIVTRICSDPSRCAP